MIVCAALKDKKTNKVFCGVRHSDIYEMLHNFSYHGDFIEGFVDEDNDFYNRSDAYCYALDHHQLPRTVVEWKEEKFETELYSEDLY